MHRLSAVMTTVGLGLFLAGCGTANPPQDRLVSVAKGVNLVFEQVCMPAILDGGDFVELARARLMTPMEPASRGTEQASHTFRLFLTGVTASLWEDGSCVVGAELGDSEQLQAQTVASLQKRGFLMNRGISDRPAVNGGVAAAYCSADAQPLILAVTTPASQAAEAHALIATLYRARDAARDICRA